MFNLFPRRDDANRLVVGMIGVKMGDRVAQIGCADGARLGAVAAKVGLSGRAVAIVPDAAAATRAQKGASQAGALVEVEIARPTRLPADDGAFDLALVDNTDGSFSALRPEDRVAAVRELLRILRPGGRVMVIGTAPRGGVGALLSRAQSGAPFDARPSLEADGFRAARMLAERDGLAFVEALKPRS
jgi:ubiquinone/menaquinone biosynthesis C-methylase UbiE